MRRRTVRLLVGGLVLAGVTAVTGCGSAGPGSGMLSVANRSDRVVFIRFETDPGRVVTYRVDPGAVGRADAPDPGRRPDRMTILAADCTFLSEQSDPALGQLVVDGRSLVSTAAADPAVASRPLLPLDATCP